MLLRRNGELESFAAGLTEELATARSQISNQAVKITEYEGKCSELANRIDELIRDSVNASTARVVRLLCVAIVVRVLIVCVNSAQKALESERSSLRASLDDARTVIAFLSSERETLTSVNADLKMQLSSRKCVNTPVDSTLAVVTKGATAAAPQPAPADQHTTIAALRSDVSVLYDQVKDFQARNKGLEAALAAKDEDIMRCVREYTLCWWAHYSVQTPLLRVQFASGDIPSSGGSVRAA